MNKSLPPTSIDVDRKLVDGLCVCVCVREASCIILHPFSRTAFRLIPFPRRIVEEEVHNSSSSQRLIDRVQGSRITLLVFVGYWITIIIRLLGANQSSPTLCVCDLF